MHRTVSVSSRVSKLIQPIIGCQKVYLSTTPQVLDSFTVQDPKDFDERVKNSKVPVVVDFFAKWCNPCRKLTPRLESIIAERKGKVILAKVDIDENADLALCYEVESIPVIMAVDNGQVVDKLVGLQDEDKLRKFVDKILSEERVVKQN